MRKPFSFREVQDRIQSLSAGSLVENLVCLLVLDDKSRRVKSQSTVVVFREIIYRYEIMSDGRGMHNMRQMKSCKSSWKKAFTGMSNGESITITNKNSIIQRCRL